MYGLALGLQKHLYKTHLSSNTFRRQAVTYYTFKQWPSSPPVRKILFDQVAKPQFCFKALEGVDDFSSLFLMISFSEKPKLSTHYFTEKHHINYVFLWHIDPRVSLSDCDFWTAGDEKLTGMIQMERSLTEHKKSICKSPFIKVLCNSFL